MKSIAEIAKILTSLGIRRSRIFPRGARNSNDTFYERFFDGVVSGEFSDDDDAANSLYGSNAGDVRFTTLKSRLREVLLTALMNIEPRQYELGELMQVTLQCKKNLVCARLLLVFGARSTGMDLIKRSMRKAEKYHLTELALECALMTQRQSAVTGHRPSFQKAAKTVRLHLDNLNAETQAETLWSELAIEFARSRSYKSDILEKARKHTARIGVLRDRHNTRSLNQTYFRMQILQSQIARDYSRTLEYCDRINEYYREHPHFSNLARRREIAIIKLNGYTFLRDFENGRALAQRALEELFSGREPGWYNINELHFLLCMHTGNYTLAAEIFVTVTNSKRFEYTTAQTHERWRILEAFLRYVLSHTGAEAPPEKATTFERRFNVYKFLNEVPIFNRDKSGFYVPILIVHILFQLEQGDFLSILDRAETLRQYSSRYLRKAGYARTNTFLKMLKIMIDQDFDPELTRAKTAKHLERLADRSADFDPVLEVTEVIPYEVLWSMVMKRLQELRTSEGVS